MNIKSMHLLFVIIFSVFLSSASYAKEIFMHKAERPTETSALLAMNNPCSNNPCSRSIPHTNPKLVLRPSWFRGLYNIDSRADLVAYGEQLFNATNLGSNGVKCSDCHADSNFFKSSFLKPYPHKVNMAEQHAGVDRAVYVDEFVQFCINVPLAGESLPWKSKQLASLTAYVIDVAQPAYSDKINAKGFSIKPDSGIPAIANPCANNACNPCGGKVLSSILAKEIDNNPCAGKVLNSVLEQEDYNGLLIPNSSQ